MKLEYKINNDRYRQGSYWHVTDEDVKKAVRILREKRMPPENIARCLVTYGVVNNRVVRKVIAWYDAGCKERGGIGPNTKKGVDGLMYWVNTNS